MIRQRQFDNEWKEFACYMLIIPTLIFALSVYFVRELRVIFKQDKYLEKK